MNAPTSRLAGVTRSGIREIMELASARPDAIHLEVGEPDFATPPHICDAASAAARAGFTRYTPSRGLPEVRAAVAAKLARVNGISADPGTDIIVTAGAANALLVTLAGAVEVGGVVLVPDPGWPNYVGMSRMLGLEVVRYPLRAEDGFQPDIEELARLATARGAGAIVLNSPSNPTGSVTTLDRVQRILEIAAEVGAVVVSDECYDQIVLSDGAEQVSPASLDGGAPVVSVFSLSKTYAMTGWRIGYLAGPREVVDPIARIQETWFSCCSAPVQKAAEAAFLGDQSPVDTMVAAYRRRREAALATAGELGLRVHPPDGAFYLMVELPGDERDGLAFARGLLERQGVAVAPGETFGTESRGMVRVSLAASEDDIVTGLRRLHAQV